MKFLMPRSFHRFVMLASVLLLTGCQTMGSSEYGVIFSTLPWFGGVKDKILDPGESEFVYPWLRIYTIDTRVQSISWGAKGRGDNRAIEDYVETRALDGNQVGLAMTVQYHIDPKAVGHVLQRVAPDNEQIRDLVTAVARADIRTHMNALRTRDFFNQTVRQAAVTRVREALATRLEPEGIIIDAVIYDDHRFERHLAGGVIDRSYQEQIDRTQAIVQETQQEKKKIRTVVEKKKQEFNEAKAIFNRKIEEVDGYKRQATLRGDAYLESKQNLAQQIEAVGMAEVEGLKKQIAALSGPGGKALLKLALVKQLVESDPQFVLVNSAAGGSGGLDLSKIDMNDLIKQAGIFAAAQEGLKDTPSSAPSSSIKLKASKETVPVPQKAQ